MIDLLEERWNRRDVDGLDGVSAEMRDLTAREYKMLWEAQTTQIAEGEVLDLLSRSVRAIDGITAGGKQVVDGEELVEHARPRILTKFVSALLVSQWQEGDAGNS